MTGHCGRRSKHSLCPACPAALSSVPMWTCPCWEFWRRWRQWSDDLVCVLISSPVAQNSLKDNEKGSMRKIIHHSVSFLCSFWIGERRLSIMLFTAPKREHLNSKKAIIRNKSGTKLKNKIANSGNFVWIHFRKIENQTDNSNYFSVIDGTVKWKQCWNALSCLITDSLMPVPWFSTVSLCFTKGIFLRKYIFFSFICFRNTANENALHTKSFSQTAPKVYSNWTALFYKKRLLIIITDKAPHSFSGGRGAKIDPMYTICQALCKCRI